MYNPLAALAVADLPGDHRGHALEPVQSQNTSLSAQSVHSRPGALRNVRDTSLSQTHPCNP
jgi:hypothetical protein